MRISQREAQRLRRRVAELESQLSMRMTQWGTDMPSWTAIGREEATPVLHQAIRTARQLKHAVVSVESSDNQIVYFACNLRGGE